MSKRMNRKDILYMTQMSLLAALVVVLQLVGTFIKIGPLPMSLVLVPIVMGACLLGVRAGVVLGFLFGIVTAVMGIVAADEFSAILFQARPFWFVVLCLAKATAAGVGAGLVYQLLEKPLGTKNKTAQTVIASIAAPILNTAVFVVGMLLFYFNVLTVLPSTIPEAFGQFSGEMEVLFLGLAGVNFIGEFVVSLMLAPAIVRVVDIVKNKLK